MMQDIDYKRKGSTRLLMKQCLMPTNSWQRHEREAEIKYSKVNERIITQRNLATTCIRAERMHHSKESVRILQKLEDRLDKQNHEQDASINQMQPISDMKLDRAGMTCLPYQTS